MEPYARCLAHLAGTDRTAYLASLAPGNDLDHRGTVLTPELLDGLVNPLRDPTTNRPRMGAVDFSEATFTGDAGFKNAKFTSRAWFDGATFAGAASFDTVTFSGIAGFRNVTFTGRAGFENAMFTDRALFGGVTFSGAALFSRVTFSGDAEFRIATFTGRAGFENAMFTERAFFGGATFAGATRFFSATFEAAPQLGPLVCKETLDLSGAVFIVPVTIEAAAAYLVCRRTRWASTGSLRLRYATVDLSDAVVEHPLRVTSHSCAPIGIRGRALDESLLTERDAGVRIISLSGIDATHLVLTDIDLAGCLFTGTVHLDQLNLDGRCTFAPAPAGFHWQGRRLLRWTPRRTLAEEHHWRAARGAAGWMAEPDGAESAGPEALAPVYRQLRKSLEDGKNEPDAADFYYGEMEMRRHDRDRPWAERALIAVYWAVSGYGLRASRAIGWLLAAMTVTLLALMLWGLPKDDPKPQNTGQLTGQRISLTTDTPGPVNPDGLLSERITIERFEKALRIVINSVVFRSSGQGLTNAGAYTEMASRITEPVLLGLAVLAARGRVKR
ncbi:hypothetical protein T261_7060 [Streptomyces lydicus]|nr:hypothetical protein T261_7060 [Streptomyces lydicus]